MRRHLVVARQTIAGQPRASRIRELSRAGPCAIFLMVPATPPLDHPWTKGEVGDGNPMLAIDDAIRDHVSFAG